jgi:hypothetical protein
MKDIYNFQLPYLNASAEVLRPSLAAEMYVWV